jgi:hypothetical protein
MGQQDFHGETPSVAECPRQRGREPWHEGDDDGTSATIAAERLYLSVLSIMSHGSSKTRHARLTEIDPIQVWINAERISIGLCEADERKPRKS